MGRVLSSWVKNPLKNKHKRIRFDPDPRSIYGNVVCGFLNQQCNSSITFNLNPLAVVPQPHAAAKSHPFPEWLKPLRHPNYFFCFIYQPFIDSITSPEGDCVSNFIPRN
jgi:hypothetical protein